MRGFSAFAGRALLGVGCVLVAVLLVAPSAFTGEDRRSLDARLVRRLNEVGFTGNAQASLEQRLGRPVDTRLAQVGRLLWFDTITGLNDDNSCAGCHSPTTGFADTQSIAIGIENNGVVGPGRTGPRNMRRAPTVVNTAFYPRLMWNSRFTALSGDPFDRGSGFLFPAPEELSLSYLPHLLTAQAFIPPTERNEVAGFDFPGDNHAIRAEVLRRLNAIDAYRDLFGRVFPAVRRGGAITFDMFGAAIAEFEFSLTFANAPLDRFARGERGALSDAEKRGALLFFGEAGCVGCHSVAGESNEMFSDFRDHVLAVPQIAPKVTNSTFDGPGKDEDFGREQATGLMGDRYAFRTAPLRNLAVQPAFMHNGAFTSLEAAIKHHLDVAASLRAYRPTEHGLDEDLTQQTGPVESLLSRLDPLVATPRRPGADQLEELVIFVRNGLLDPRVRPEHLRRLVPRSVPSGRRMLQFEFPGRKPGAHLLRARLHRNPLERKNPGGFFGEIQSWNAATPITTASPKGSPQRGVNTFRIRHASSSS
jgi:cytochrome c peroxidase